MEHGSFIDGLPIKNGDFLWLCQITRWYINLTFTVATLSQLDRHDLNQYPSVALQDVDAGEAGEPKEIDKRWQMYVDLLEGNSDFNHL